MLIEYIQNNYRVNEPIFLSDIDLPVTNTNLRQMFKVLCDKGLIYRFDSGIYYMKGTSRLKGGIVLSSSDVVKYKYIVKKDVIEGYYSGYTFANQFGITTQVPYTLEIVSNNASAKCREVCIKNQKIILRKPRAKITNENYYILQLLDLVKDIEQYVDSDIDMNEVSKKLCDYIQEKKISRTQIDEYIFLFPNRIYKYIYEMRLYDAFA